MSQVVENRFVVGDLVRVIDADSVLHGLEGYIARTDFGAPPKVYLFESDDNKNRCWFAVDSLRKLRDSWAEPATDHNADATKTANPSETPNSSLPVAELVKGLSQAMQHDQDLAWTWHCSIAMASCDEGACPSVANLAAARFMRIAFGVDVTTFDQWKWAERASAQLLAGTPDRIAEVAKMVNPSETPNSSLPDPLNCIGNICDLAESTGVTCPVDSCDLDTGCRQAPADHIPDATKMVNTPETPDISTAKRPVVYIAGPMRGIPHFNFPAFDAAKAYLIGKGYDVLSPADFDRVLDDFDPYKPEYETADGCGDFPQEMDFKRVVTRDLTAVTQCDAVALLPGWEKSKGAVAEIAVAHWMGKPVLHLLFEPHRPNEIVYIVNDASTTLEQFVLQLAHAHDAFDKRINCLIDPAPPELNPDCDILEVAASITRGDRQAVYGPPDQDFKKTADMWTGMFQLMLAPGAKFEPRHVAMAMICLKLSREFHQRKRDNWIDIAGYARCGSLCSS